MYDIDTSRISDEQTPEQVFLSSISSGAGLREAVLEVLYPAPRPYETQEQQAQYFHEDLPRLTGEQLVVERTRLEFVLAFDSSPAQSDRAIWLRERAAAVTREEAARRGKRTL
jgi:hypothetical protein